MNYSLVVGRDKAHTRELSPHYKGAKIFSASEFFDKIRIISFIHNPHLKQNDEAVLLFAQALLASQKQLPLFFASNLQSLYSSIFHGLATPKEIIDCYESKNLDVPYEINLCQKINEEMNKKKLVNKVQALYMALNVIKEKNYLPPSFITTPKILLLYLVDLTNLEIEVIKALAKLGLRFDIKMPFDFEARGINTGVYYIAKQFEKDLTNDNIELIFEEVSSTSKLSPLCQHIFKDNVNLELNDENCSFITASDQITEAKQVAQKIAFLKEQDNQKTIALVVRSMDKRAKLYKQTLESFGVPVRDRKGVVLNETNAGFLLNLIFNSINEQLLKNDLISLLNHPLFSLKIEDKITLNETTAIINSLNIGEFIIAYDTCRYEESLNQLLEIYKTDLKKLKLIEETKEKIKNISSIKNLFKKYDRIENFLHALQTITSTYFVGEHEDDSLKHLKEHIKNLSRNISLPEHELSIKDFFRFIRDFLNKKTIPRKDYDDEKSVEFLLMPEVLGRSFDHIFVVDMAFGRIPQSISTDPFFDDEKRVLLNKGMQKPILKIFFDDPFEPSVTPPRQALEPFWFACVITSAIKSICFSHALFDFQGKEQAVSDFFLWLKKYVSIKNLKQDQHYINKKEAIFINEQKDGLALKAFNERENFLRGNICDSFSFKLDKNNLSKGFDNRLDINSKKVLTPTFIESFSKCRFAGFLNRVLKVEEQKEKIDVDNKTTGEIAHKTLEQFFAQKINFSSIEEIDFSLKNILTNVANEYLKTNLVNHKDIFFCYVEWLHELLTQLVFKILSRENNDNHVIGQEIAFGLGKNKAKAIRLKSKNGEYLVGGIIDRIDKIGNTYLITDYKLSSLKNIKTLTQKNYLFSKHFQMPIYIRLISDNFKNKNISFLFASIKDGALFKEINQWNDEEIFERIFNDEREDSLANCVDDIFFPLKEGKVLASASEHCKTCQYNFVCRV